MIWDFLKKRSIPMVPPNPFREVEIGSHATAILDSGVLQTMKEHIHLSWSRSPIRDAEGQHELRLMLKLVNDMEDHFQTQADTAKMAAIQIETDKLKVANG